MTSPTLPGSGRCGECRTWGGKRKISPSRIGTSRGPAVVHHAQHHVALQLEEELLQWIVVIVGPLVRAADDGDDEVGVFPHLRVADRWLEQSAVFVDPPLQIERGA
jgi:hypothetical protein